jgi:hypothetical protein
VFVSFFALWVSGTCVAQSSASAAPPRNVALVIGISNYRDDSIPSLRYASEDAQDIGAIFERYGYVVTVLRDRDATREAILRAISQLRATLTRNDRFVLYFAGRLLGDQLNDSPYLATHDTERGFLEVNGIRIEQIIDYLGNLRARNALVLLDHAYTASRGFEQRGLEVQKAFDAASNRITQRGVTIVTVVGEERYALEDLERGAFAAALLEALDSGFADANQDGTLAVTEIVDFTVYEVNSLARDHGYAEPSMGRFGYGTDDWPVIELSDSVTAQTDESAFASKQRNLYTEMLSQFANEKSISVRTRVYVQGLLDRWVASVETRTSLSAEDRAALNSVNAILSSPSSDREKARLLESYQSSMQMQLKAPLLEVQ